MLKFIVGKPIPEEFLINTNYQPNKDTCSLIASSPMNIFLSYHNLSASEHDLIINGECIMSVGEVHEVPYITMRFTNKEGGNIIIDMMCLTIEEGDFNAVNILLNDSKDTILKGVRVLGVNIELIKFLQKKVEAVKDIELWRNKSYMVQSKYSTERLEELSQLKYIAGTEGKKR
jgi:hypothetical protein